VSLRFIPDVLQLEMGVPAAAVRLVRVWSDGATEDVENLAEITLSRADVVEQSWTAAGPVFRALAPGRTRGVATLDGLTTRRPLLIDVAPPGGGGQPRLAAYPGRISLRVGESAVLQSVQIIPGRGATPFSVDYQITSNDPQIVSVVEGRSLRGVAPGQTRLTVTPVGAGAQYQGLATTIFVGVTAEPESGGVRLVLTGPSRATVGATVQFQSEIVTDSGSRLVTNEQTTLDVSRGAVDPPTALGGCALRLGETAELLTIQASHRGILSNMVQLRVAPLARRFASLELDIDHAPLVLGERRSYRVWGYPAGGEQRQDLTNTLTDDLANDDPTAVSQLQVVLSSDGASPVAHVSPVVTAVSPGSFRLRAVRGALQSDVVALDVVPADGGRQILTAAPSSMTIRVGETSGEILASMRSISGGPPRQVTATFTSEDPTIASPASAGRFTGQAVGRTRIMVEAGGQQTAVDVLVVGSYFMNVALEAPDLGDRSFTVQLQVEGLRGPNDVEYRVVTAGVPGGTPWQTATPTGDRVIITLESPQIPNGPRGQLYNLTLEARSVGGSDVERRSIPFRISAQ